MLRGAVVSACATRAPNPGPIAGLLVSLAASLALSLACAPSTARASDGYELAIPLSGALIGTIALDITFIVATSVGLTDHDDAWAALELVYGVLGMAGCAIGAGYAIDQHVDGLAGALVLQGIGSAIFTAFGVLGLESEHPPNIEVAIAPGPDGFMFAASMRL